LCKELDAVAAQILSTEAQQHKDRGNDRDGRDSPSDTKGKVKRPLSMQSFKNWIKPKIKRKTNNNDAHQTSNTNHGDLAREPSQNGFDFVKLCVTLVEKYDVADCKILDKDDCYVAF
jgi:hypothetical protein